jgi:transcriptional regulator with XRE-family HTH domain
MLASEIVELRGIFGLKQSGFARLLGVDTRTVSRWEKGTVEAGGTGAAVMAALREKLTKDPDYREETIAFVLKANEVGGLSYLLVKLLDRAVQ